jgi:hypothetical protein
MSRKIFIARTLRLCGVFGLVKPLRRPQRHVLDWTIDGLKRPPYFRWSWHPPTSDLLVGTPHRHVDQIREQRPKIAFESWLRGFVMYPERTIAIRPYFWPKTPYDAFDQGLNEDVTTAAVRLLRPLFPNYRIERGVDNQWLLQNFGHYAHAW